MHGMAANFTSESSGVKESTRTSDKILAWVLASQGSSRIAVPHIVSQVRRLFDGGAYLDF